MGDPRGIGPEVVVKALAELSATDLLVVGDAQVLQDTAQSLGITPPPQVMHVPAARSTGGVKFVEVAHGMAADGAAAGIVTAPIRKVRKKLFGDVLPGHTELLSQWAGVDPPASLMMVTKKLKVTLATNHVPLAAVPEAVTEDAVLLAIQRTDTALREWFGLETPTIAVLGLNPHAGEGGYLGDEEKTVIGPAIARAVEAGIAAQGPLPADSALHFVTEGRWDAAVAMYHDQGLVAAKLGGFGEAVNVSLGLPYVRTSVDHGVAEDIVGKGIADPASLIAAIKLARRLVRNTK